MAEVPSTFTLKTGDSAPAFTLPDAAGNQHSLSDILGEKGTLVAFVCNHCPFVVHLATQLGDLAKEYAGQGINTVAISSNDVENYPQDAPDKMAIFAEESGWEFPYLYDETQQIAHAYSAACTPDFFLFNGDGKLFYAGQFDNSRPRNDEPIDGSDLRAAMNALLSEGSPVIEAKPATGCNIKWRPGNEPAYFG